MNEPIDWIWFQGGKGKVGVVKMKNDRGKLEYRIGAADGFLEKMDVIQLMAWGAKIPDKAGKAFFEGRK